MKKILFAALIASVALVGCKGKNGVGGVGSTDSTQIRVPSGQVAYINIDSLVSKYDLYLDLRADYETKAKKADAELTSKGRSLEKEVRDFQDKIQKGLVTRAQAATMEEDLGRKQQTFMQHRDNVMREMAEEEQVLLNRIHYSIVDFLKVFNSDYRYGMILSTSASGPILNADPMLDITSVVLVELNKNYASDKSKNKSAAAPKETPKAE